MARKNLSLTEQDKAEMLRLYIAETKSLADISTKFGVSISTVSRLLRGMGCVMRPRGNRTCAVVNSTTTSVVNFYDSIEETEPKAVFSL